MIIKLFITILSRIISITLENYFVVSFLFANSSGVFSNGVSTALRT